VSGVDEFAFEEFICSWLVSLGRYVATKIGRAQSPPDFDVQSGIDTAELFAFVGATQGTAWSDLLARYGNDAGQAQRGFVRRLAQQIDARGTVDVIRHGVEDLGVAFRLAYFKPASGLTPESIERYETNRLTVTRQLPYEANSTKTLDLCLFVNGIPVATAELKNPITGQTVEHARAQYRTDRDPKNPLLRRAIVHFAVDTEAVSMTTRLSGNLTRFLPFNRGYEMGAGNPPNADGHRTAYLWEQVWQRDAWLDLLQRFVHVEPTPKGSKVRPVVIFPRYHQWNAVRSLTADAREHGAGRDYLVQHSAGSGKSNTIAWMAHRLSSLHDATDQKVFDKVVVITDRRVLDRQLQDTIYQFEHAYGVVMRIDENSQQLADALAGEQARIIITTLQKFPFVTDKIESLPSRCYAVIVDLCRPRDYADTGRVARSGGGPCLDSARHSTGERAAAPTRRCVGLPRDGSAPARRERALWMVATGTLRAMGCSHSDDGPAVAIFTPGNEPYLGRDSVFHFDQMIQAFLEHQAHIARWTHEHEPTAIQLVASELIPSASSIALSIRELVRQGYLLSAQILARPLWERVATLSYLIEHETAIELWRSGWPHKSRPDLRERMQSMHSREASPEVDTQLRAVINDFNSLVHGDPAAASAVEIVMSDGRLGYTLGRDLSSPQKVDMICFTSAMLLVVLLSRSAQLFPDVSHTSLKDRDP
jgi:hypothetical protein